MLRKCERVFLKTIATKTNKDVSNIFSESYLIKPATVDISLSLQPGLGISNVLYVFQGFFYMNCMRRRYRRLTNIFYKETCYAGLLLREILLLIQFLV